MDRAVWTKVGVESAIFLYISIPTLRQTNCPLDLAELFTALKYSLADICFSHRNLLSWFIASIVMQTHTHPFISAAGGTNASLLNILVLLLQFIHWYHKLIGDMKTSEWHHHIKKDIIKTSANKNKAAARNDSFPNASRKASTLFVVIKNSTLLSYRGTRSPCGL